VAPEGCHLKKKMGMLFLGFKGCTKKIQPPAKTVPAHGLARPVVNGPGSQPG
jgi:hypothetical protein